MDQHRREEQQQEEEDHLLFHKEEQGGSLRRCKEQLLGPDAVHTTNLLGENTSSVQLQCSPGNAGCSVPSASVGLSGALSVVGQDWTFQNGGDTTPMPSPGGDLSSMHKRGRGRPRKDQQSQAKSPPQTPTASRRGIKVGCGRPMLAPTYGDTGPPRRPIIIEKLPAAWWSVDAASTGIKRPRGRPRKYRPSTPETGGATSAGIKRGRGRPRKERPDAASSGIKRGRGRPRKERPDAASSGIKRRGGQLESEMEMLAAAAAMLSETGDDALPMGTKRAVENPRSVDVVSMGMEGALENPNPRTENPRSVDVASTGGIKRGRGRPRKNQQSQALMTPTALSTGGIKRGPGRPRKDQQSQAGCGRPMIIAKPPAEWWSVDAATTGIKRPRGRPRKETPSVAISAETGDATPAPETGDATPAPETGDATPAPETGDATPAPETGDAMSVPETGDATSAPETGDAVPAEAGDAVSAVIKRGRGRPRKERPDAASAGIKRGMSAEAGDATPAPETGRATTTATKRPRGRPRKERPDAALSGVKRGMSAEAGDATPAPETGRATTTATKRPRGRPRKERPDAALSGVKRGRGRPRKEKPEARMCAKTGGTAASMGFKRWGGQREPGMDMLAAAAAAAMLAESGDDAVATGGSKGAVEDPSNPRMEKASSAGDIVWMVMNRGGPRKEQPPVPGPGFGSWFGDMAEASRRSKHQEEAGGGENH